MNGTESGSGNRAKLENGSNANANGNGVQLWKQQQQQQEGLAAASQKGRANEVEELLLAVKDLVIPYIKSADEAHSATSPGCTNGKLNGNNSHTSLVDPDALSPARLSELLDFSLPEKGLGKDGLLGVVSKVLKYSVNTWNPGFMDKLYASTNAPGVASELILSVLNTNVHVYQVSPALTIIEKTTARRFASLFGFNDDFSGGITLPGGSYSNSHSLIIARNTLYPKTKTKGNGSHKFVVFTSTHGMENLVRQSKFMLTKDRLGHYSVEKAAIMCGLGSDAVWQIPVDKGGSMIVSELEKKILQAKREGYTPFYVNAGAGTTVLGSYDPFFEIGQLCQKYGLWFHVDGSWGGSVIFSERLKYKLAGVHLANSLTVNPHKMLGVPMTCSFLLTRDTRVFHKANTLKAGYLFHNLVEDDELYDLADMTLGCGRRGDSLKMALGWIYYGKDGYESKINHAFEIAGYFTNALSKRNNFHLISSNPPPCLQVCFFYTPEGILSDDASLNTQRTRRIATKLIEDGFMVDYAPDESRGDFFRAVINSQTSATLIDSLIQAIEKHSMII